jgi:metallo-beta-lactamase class B
VKELTGAQVMAMREDVPALEAMKPAGKAHPIDRTLRDGEEVSLGDTRLVAHLTPGHTRGCTTWTMKALEGGKTFNVVFACSYRAPAPVTPGDRGRVHPHVHDAALAPVRCAARRSPGAIQHDREARDGRSRKTESVRGPGNCWNEAEIQEAMFRAQLEMQRQAVK